MSYIARIAQDYNRLKLSKEEGAYYARHLLLPDIGTSGQLKLKCARVLVVGAGGLGCPAMQSLAGAGVGRVTVVDGDFIEASNIARQWLHSYTDRGQNKAESAAAKLRGLNPFIEVVSRAVMLDSGNVEGLIGAHDIVIDASDDIAVRYLLDEACEKLDTPWVHAALYRDSAQLTVFWARYGARFRTLFPSIGAAADCAAAGIMGASASVMGNLQALEVIKLITASAAPLVGELLTAQTTSITFRRLELPGVQRAEAVEQHLAQTNYEVTLEEWEQARSIHQLVWLVDVRSEKEFNAGSLPEAVHCPAETVLTSGLPEEVAHSGKVALFCSEGLVSALLVEALRAQGLERVYVLRSWSAALQ